MRLWMRFRFPLVQVSLEILRCLIPCMVGSISTGAQKAASCEHRDQDGSLLYQRQDVNAKLRRRLVDGHTGAIGARDNSLHLDTRRSSRR